MISLMKMSINKLSNAKLSSKDYTTAIIVSLITIVINMLLISNTYHDWGGDFSQYIMQANSINSKSIPMWLSKNTFIVNNSIPGLAPIAYPWGYPVLLSISNRFCGDSLYAYKMINIICYGLFILIFYCWIKKRTNNIVSIMLTLFLSLNYYLLMFQDQVISDVCSMMFVMLTIYVFDYYDNTNNNVLSCFFGFLLFMCYFVRTQNILLLVSLFMYQIINYVRTKRTDNIIKYSLTYLVFITLFIINKITLPSGSGTYLSFVNNVNVRNAFVNIKNYYCSINMLFPFTYYIEQIRGIFPLLPLFIIKNIVFVFLPFLLFGLYKLIKKEMFSVLYFFLIMTMLSIYPYYQGIRFIFSIIFILAYATYYGYKCILNNKTINLVVVLSMIVFIFLNVMLIKNTILNKNDINNQLDNSYSKLAIETYNYINDNINDDKIIYFNKPRVLYMFTNNYSYGGINDYSIADYALICPAIYEYELELYVSNYECIFSNDYFRLYKLK